MSEEPKADGRPPTRAYVRLAREDELSTLALVAREAFIADPNFNYIADLKAPLSNDEASSKRRTLEKFLRLLFGASIAAGGRVTVAVLPNEFQADAEEKIVASCIWLPPNKRLSLGQIFTMIRFGFFSVLRGWGLKGLKRVGIDHSRHCDEAWKEVWKKRGLQGSPDDEWYLILACTSPQHQGNGYLSLLIREMFAYVPEKTLTLEAGTPKSRDRYAHLGFELQHTWVVAKGKVSDQGLKGQADKSGMTFWSMVRWGSEH